VTTAGEPDRAADRAPAHDDRPFRRLDRAVARTRELTRDRRRTGLRPDDADEETGTIGTDGAIGFDPWPLLHALRAVTTPVAVIGQVAGILHGSAELTGDLDLLWSGDSGHAAELAAAFAAIEARLVDHDGRPLPCTAESFLLPKVEFESATVSGDCCTPALPWGDLAVGEFLGRSRHVRSSDGRELRYLTVADLIAMRRAVGRPKDLRRADELARLP